MLKEDNISKEALKGFKEFELAWQEFFKDKPEPTNDEEERKEQEEFHYWYNHVRKQSDTGKTPAEMYKEVYGKEPEKNPSEPSRMMNFEWDEEDGEFDEDKLDDAQEEAVVIATQIFEDSWKRIKQEVEGVSKKEACRYSFIMGFMDYMKMMDKRAEIIGEEIKDMPKEDIEKMINDFMSYNKDKGTV